MQQVKVKQAMAQKISAKQIVNLQSPSLIPYIAHTQHIKLVPENPMFPSIHTVCYQAQNFYVCSARLPTILALTLRSH